MTVIKIIVVIYKMLLFPKTIMQLGRRSIFSYLSVEFCVVSEYDLRKWFF